MCSLLKQFLRRLPEPLLLTPRTLRPRLLAAAALPEGPGKVAAVAGVLADLPADNRRTVV